MINKHCKGCLIGIVYQGIMTDALCSTKNKDGSCPCGLCVVKMMCSKRCEKRSDWIMPKLKFDKF